MRAHGPRDGVGDALTRVLRASGGGRAGSEEGDPGARGAATCCSVGGSGGGGLRRGKEGSAGPGFAWAPFRLAAAASSRAGERVRPGEHCGAAAALGARPPLGETRALTRFFSGTCRKVFLLELVGLPGRDVSRLGPRNRPARPPRPFHLGTSDPGDSATPGLTHLGASEPPEPPEPPTPGAPPSTLESLLVGPRPPASRTRVPGSWIHPLRLRDPGFGIPPPGRAERSLPGWVGGGPRRPSPGSGCDEEGIRNR